MVEPTEGEVVRFGTFWCEALLLSAPVSGLRSPFSAGALKLAQAALMTAWVACAAPSLHAMAGTRARTVTMATVWPP
jgi:hypothetical protein